MLKNRNLRPLLLASLSGFQGRHPRRPIFICNNLYFYQNKANTMSSKMSVEKRTKQLTKALSDLNYDSVILYHTRGGENIDGNFQVNINDPEGLATFLLGMATREPAFARALNHVYTRIELDVKMATNNKANERPLPPPGRSPLKKV